LIASNIGGKKYLVRGILFKLAQDVQLGVGGPWLFGGSRANDEYANKAAGHDLKGAMGYLQCSLAMSGKRRALSDRMLRIPMQSLIDHRGFRLIALPFLPLKRTSDSSPNGQHGGVASRYPSAYDATNAELDAEIKEQRRVREDWGSPVAADDNTNDHDDIDIKNTPSPASPPPPPALVYRSSATGSYAAPVAPAVPIGGRGIDNVQEGLIYGSSDMGVTVHCDHTEFNSCMLRAAQALHLAPHTVNGRTLFSAGDVEGHIGLDRRFYLLDLARTFR
jgi:hypothetical protein